jgi:mannose-6-phosphate isomerase-like protein (cupin superfamily)
MVQDYVHAPVVLADGEGEHFSVRGVEITFKSPIGTEDGWTVLDYKMPARQFGAPLHYHEKLTETFYVLSGEIWFRVGDEEYTAGPGTFILVPPGVKHSFANRSDSPARLLGHASHPDLKKLLREIFAMVEAEPVWPPKDPRVLMELGKRYDTVYLI